MNAAMETQAKAGLRRFQPYPAYKDSGLEWLGKIPAHWEIRALKRGFAVRLGKMLQNQPSSSMDTLEFYLRAANLTWSGVDLSDIRSMWFSPEEKRLYELKPGDLLVSEGGDVGRASRWRGELSGCYIQNAINRVRTRGADLTDFLFYWIYALKHLGYIDMLCSKATISHFTAEKVEALPVLFPEIHEQTGIAKFLDRETAKIDALLAKKERLIALLQEKRAALITRAVTKGLDPNVPMKDSGVEWLGEIPAHWDVRRIRGIAEFFQTGPFGTQLHSEDYFPGGVPVVNPAHMKNGRILPDWDSAVDQETLLRLAQHELHEGDIVFARRGELGRCALVTSAEAGWLCGTGSLQMRPNPEVIDSRYLIWLLSTSGVADWLLLKSVGSTMDNLNTSILANLPLCLPPLREQHDIAAFLQHETVKIDALVIRIRQGIEGLKEYRTALISAAVTGKIDVRGTAA